jgi:hypothetical protein
MEATPNQKNTDDTIVTATSETKDDCDIDTSKEQGVIVESSPKGSILSATKVPSIAETSGSSSSSSSSSSSGTSSSGSSSPPQSQPSATAVQVTSVS